MTGHIKRVQICNDQPSLVSCVKGCPSDFAAPDQTIDIGAGFPFTLTGSGTATALLTIPTASLTAEMSAAIARSVSTDESCVVVFRAQGGNFFGFGKMAFGNTFNSTVTVVGGDTVITADHTVTPETCQSEVASYVANSADDVGPTNTGTIPAEFTLHCAEVNKATLVSLCDQIEATPTALPLFDLVDITAATNDFNFTVAGNVLNGAGFYVPPINYPVGENTFTIEMLAVADPNDPVSSFEIDNGIGRRSFNSNNLVDVENVPNGFYTFTGVVNYRSGARSLTTGAYSVTNGVLTFVGLNGLEAVPNYRTALEKVFQHFDSAGSPQGIVFDQTGTVYNPLGTLDFEEPALPRVEFIPSQVAQNQFQDEWVPRATQFNAGALPFNLNTVATAGAKIRNVTLTYVNGGGANDDVAFTAPNGDTGLLIRRSSVSFGNDIGVLQNGQDFTMSAGPNPAGGGLYMITWEEIV